MDHEIRSKLEQLRASALEAIENSWDVGRVMDELTASGVIPSLMVDVTLNPALQLTAVPATSGCGDLEQAESDSEFLHSVGIATEAPEG